MILSRGRRYLFIHIPKTGGTSIARALESRAMKDDILLGDTPKARQRRHRVKGVEARGRLWKHSTLADLEGLVTAEEARELFVFTLVRNPWDRVASYYRWLKAQRFDHPAVTLAQHLGFSDFIRHPHTQTALRASPARTYVTDGGGTERARLFIRLEHLGEDAVPLWEHLGFRLAIPHDNASTPGGTIYGPGDVEVVAELCAEDAARFGYGPENARILRAKG